MATVAALGATQMGQGEAAALTIPNPTSSVSDVIGALANNGLTQTVATQWRFNLCAADSDGGPVSGGADCSGSTGVGAAVVLPSTIDLVPDTVYKPSQSIINGLATNVLTKQAAARLGLTVPVPDAALPEGSAKIIGDGFQFALASGGGNATAISYLPVSLATAGASDGRQAFAFAVVGMANAWTTSAIPIEIFTLPTGVSIPAIRHVSCYGGLTAAYAEDVGACVNILGTFDFRYDADDSEVQFGLTDPSAILFDPSDVLGKVLRSLFDSNVPFTLSKDFARITLGGGRTDAYGLPVVLTATSDYGTQGPITLNWLGTSVKFNPEVTVNGVTKPNHLGLPAVTFTTLDTGQIIPVVSIPKINFPFGIPPVAPTVIPSPTATALQSPSPLRGASDNTVTADNSATAEQTATDNPTDDSSTASAGDTGSTGSGYVGRHRSESTSPGYVGRHRDQQQEPESGPAPTTTSTETAPTATTSTATTPTATTPTGTAPTPGSDNSAPGSPTTPAGGTSPSSTAAAGD